jgi:hypothetical protein
MRAEHCPQSTSSHCRFGMKGGRSQPERSGASQNSCATAVGVDGGRFYAGRSHGSRHNRNQAQPEIPSQRAQSSSGAVNEVRS